MPVSKMSDNEDATPALWNSEVLSVQSSVGEPIPEFLKSGQETGERMAFVCVILPSSITVVRVIGSVFGSAGIHSGDVLPYQPAGPQALSQSKKFKREVAALSSHTRSESCDTEVLTGGSTDKKVNWPGLVCLDFREVAKVPRFWIVVSQHRARKLVNLGERHGLPSHRSPCHRRR